MKYNKIILTTTILILIFLTLNIASAEDNITDNTNYQITNTNTIYINNSYHGNIEDGSQNHPYKNINTGINTAIKNSKPNIYIANGEYTINRPITIRNSNINIIGESTNVILNAKTTTNFFKLNTGNYTIHNITFTNGEATSNRGYSTTYGGAILINATGDGGYTYRKQTLPFDLFSLKITNCIFKNNYADYGGAIYGSNGNIIIKDSTFYNNSAIDGGAINLEYCNTTIINTKFNKNSAVYGGAAYLDTNLNNIHNTNFENNQANVGAGIFTTGGILNIQNTQFNKNTAEDEYANGGAIFISQTQTQIDNSIFNENKATGTIASASAIYSASSLGLTINNTTISNNTVLAEYSFGTIANKGFLTINNTNIYNNYINSNNRIDETIYNINGIIKTENTNITNNNFKGTKTRESLYYIDFPIITGQVYTENTTLPEKYDLRNITLPNGTTTSGLTSVKNQLSLGTCWAFASLGALESHLKLTEGIEYDFSELNMNNLADYGKEGYDSQYYGDGGDFYTATAYLTRWSGPVNESDDPYKTNSKTSPNNLTVIKHIQDIIFIPIRENYQDLNQIKQTIIK